MRKFGLLSTVALLFATVTTGPALAGEYVLFYHNDTLGSPVAVTDINGNIVWRADYEPFGNVATLTETLPNTHQFLGKEVDAETSLHSLGARFYDGSLGRFLSVDPILLRGRPAAALKLPQRLNFYVYTTNNPYRYVDPSGLTPSDNSGATTSSADDTATERTESTSEGGQLVAQLAAQQFLLRTRGGRRGPEIEDNPAQEWLGIPKEMKITSNVHAKAQELRQLVPYGREVMAEIFYEEATGTVLGSRFEGQDLPAMLWEGGPRKSQTVRIRGLGPEVKPKELTIGPAR